MKKKEFLNSLREGLKGLPESEVTGRLKFYEEMIDDMIEDGKTEQEAVMQLGTVDGIVSEIISETPITKIVKERVKNNRRLKAWEIVLIVLGFPVWFPILISLFAVILSLYICVWAVICSLWAVFAALGAGACYGFASGVTLARGGYLLKGLVVIGFGLLLSGLCIFAFFGCKAATKGIITLTKKIALKIKSSVVKGGKTE